MRLCILTTSYPRYIGDDAGIFVERLTSAISKLVKSLIVVVPQDGASPEHEVRAAVSIERVRYGFFSSGRLAFGSGIPTNLKANPWLFWQFPGLALALWLKLVRLRHSYDLVQANWVFSGAIAWLARFVTGKPYLLTIRGTEVKLLNQGLFRWLFAPALKNASFVISVNESFLGLLQQRYSLAPEKLIRIPNGVDLSPIDPKHYREFLVKRGFEQSKAYLLFVGTLHRGKGITRLIELLAQPGMQGQKFELILCGRDDDQKYLSELKRKATELNCLERVHFEGMVSPASIPYYLKLARYYVTASEHEGMSNSVLEALAAGLIVFASAIQAHRELVIDAENGFIFGEDLGTVATKIGELESNQALYQLISSKARRSIEQFSWDRSAERYCTLFSKVAGKS